jgi:hypothetical protein
MAGALMLEANYFGDTPTHTPKDIRRQFRMKKCCSCELFMGWDSMMTTWSAKSTAPDWLVSHQFGNAQLRWGVSLMEFLPIHKMTIYASLRPHARILYTSFVERWYGYVCQGPCHWYPLFIFGLRPMKITTQVRRRRKDESNMETTLQTDIYYEIVSYPTRTLGPSHLYKGPGGAGGGTRWDLACNHSFVSIIQLCSPCLSVLPLNSSDAHFPQS